MRGTIRSISGVVALLGNECVHDGHGRINWLRPWTDHGACHQRHCTAYHSPGVDMATWLFKTDSEYTQLLRLSEITPTLSSKIDQVFAATEKQAKIWLLCVSD